MSVPGDTAPETLDHVVVGGGLSGLAYAWRRAREGRRVLVLEARDRVGGRIATERLDRGYVLDHGPVAVAGPGLHLRELSRSLPGAPAPAEPPPGVEPPLLRARRGLARDRKMLLDEVTRRPVSVLLRLPLIGRKTSRGHDATVPRVFAEGTASLTDALAEALGDRVHLGVRAERVRPGFPCVVERAAGTAVAAREVALDLPADEQARLLERDVPHLADVLGAVVHEPVVTASIGLGPRDAARLPPAAGFHGTGASRVLDAVFTSHLATWRAPRDHALVTLRLGGGSAETLLDLEDETLARIATVELGRALGTRLEPDLVRVHRDPRGRLRRGAGHQGRMAALAATLGDRGIHLLGRVALGDSLDRLASAGAPATGPLPEGVVA